MDSWTYWGPSSPQPPLFTFLFLLFPFSSTAVTLGKSTLRRRIVFIHLRPPAPFRETNAIRTLRRLESHFSRLCRTKKFAAVPQKIASCSEKSSKIPEFPSVVSKADVAFLSVRFVFFLTARAVIWCFFVAPTRGQHSLPYGGPMLIYYVNRRS